MAMTVFQSAKGQAEGSVAKAINMVEGNDLAKDTNCEVSKENPPCTVCSLRSGDS